ncbi:hypothetical protein ISN44_As06g042770 [Arabidopsis suecica]|uniref:Uncharacterized protein n=1 Tax=Arabidopsis suecica TaxID=45249 RepID=A0A8T2CKS8_ARASU|nr:hypothetical protein ISN44_As06g042770 [Arabidopsis suecica]
MANVGNTNLRDQFITLCSDLYQAQNQFQYKCAELVRNYEESQPKKVLEEKKMDLEKLYEKLKEVMKNFVAFAAKIG